MSKPISHLPRTINASQMRSVNRSAILELIRRSSPIARSQISRQLGLSLPTIMRVVDNLIAEDLVRPTGEKERSAGRSREMLEYHKDGHAVISIDLGGTKMYGALANIGGEILAEISLDRHQTSGEESFDCLVGLVRELLNAPNKSGQLIRGLAIGAPGVTLSQSGTVVWAPSLNWRDFPLKQRLEAIFDLPVVVENDVNLMALGESWFGVGQGVQNLIVIAIGTGMGAGIIIDGVLYRGFAEHAGEVGYMIPGRELVGCHFDHFGALESIVSGTGIAERGRRALNEQHSPAQLTNLTANDVFAAARLGEPWAYAVIDETVDYLTITIANTATVLDPELIVLSGGVCQSADLLIPPLRQRIEGMIQRVPRIEISSLGSQATIMGAIALMVYNTTDYYLVRRPY